MTTQTMKVPRNAHVTVQKIGHDGLGLVQHVGCGSKFRFPNPVHSSFRYTVAEYVDTTTGDVWRVKFMHVSLWERFTNWLLGAL